MLASRGVTPPGQSYACLCKTHDSNFKRFAGTASGLHETARRLTGSCCSLRRTRKDTRTNRVCEVVCLCVCVCMYVCMYVYIYIYIYIYKAQDITEPLQ